jgi:hypothetical protein
MPYMPQTLPDVEAQTLWSLRLGGICMINESGWNVYEYLGVCLHVACVLPYSR